METRKALIIDSTVSQSVPQSGWIDLNEISNFIKNIRIPEIDKDKDGSVTADTSSLVSGMPSVFAKANLFKNALDYGLDMSSHSNGLQAIYKSHILEWRGFLSCIALEYSHLNIQRIYLRYTDNQPIDKTQNVFEAFGAFGNMLFEKETLWSIHEEGSENRGAFVDVIKFHDKLIGGISPESFLFTAASYKLGDFPFTSRGKFTDPYKKENALTQEESNTIRAFIYNILKNNLGKFSEIIKKATQIDDLYVNLSEQLIRWSKEIEEYERAKGWKTIAENLSPPEVNKFDYPYSVLFNYSTELYGLFGTIYAEDPRLDGTIKFKPTDLLLPKEAKIIRIQMEECFDKNDDYLLDRPLFLLRAKVIKNSGETGRYEYFTLPLTSKALEIFGDNLPALLGLDDNIPSKLKGVFNEDDKKLSVELELTTLNDSIRKFYIIYNLEDVYGINGKGQDILIWPNFINAEWNRYFMYSEIPHNGIEYKVVPFLGAIDHSSHSLNTIYKDSAKNVPFFIADRGATSSYDGPQLYEGHEQKNPQVKLIIENNARVQDNKYKYEIYESNYPFKGLKFSYKNADAGYAIISYKENESSLDSPSNRPFFYNPSDPKPVHLGIDFGSTNTSIAYYNPEDGGDAKGFDLTNKRISLLSNDNKDNSQSPTIENEIFFFQNEKVSSNALKSTLTLHQSKRISNIIQNCDEVYGGFPCFEYNLPIKNSDNSRINLYFKQANNVELVYNMKWSDSASDPKLAYLKTLLLHVYAQLFTKKFIPVKLKWSYPSAMPLYLRNNYSLIFERLKLVNPLKGHALEISNFNSGVDNNISDYPSSSIQFKPLEDGFALSESSAVANYFLQKDNLNPGNYMIIFDIGGSTTDISVITAANRQKQIIKQNSFKWAAQRISQAIPFIPEFNRMLLEFCRTENIKIKGLNYPVEESVYNKETASYFYEQIVSRLKSSQFSSFYSRIAGNCPNLMSINLYVTGLIMYYAGQLAYKLTEEINQITQNTEKTNEVKPMFKIVFAGNGARIFDWFVNYNKTIAKQYYDNMFIKGMGGKDIVESRIKFEINFNNDSKEGTKYEVSKGLALTTRDIYISNSKQSIEIIGEEGFGLYRPDGSFSILDSSNAITPDMMRDIGTNFHSSISDTDKPFPRFMDFYQTFQTTATNYFGFGLPSNMYFEGLKRMNIENFIRSLPEYTKAENKPNETFDFIAPIFIMEGIKFYENTILNYLSTKR